MFALQPIASVSAEVAALPIQIYSVPLGYVPWFIRKPVDPRVGNLTAAFRNLGSGGLRKSELSDFSAALLFEPV